MSQFRCPRCRKQTFGVNEIGRPFPRPLRRLQVRLRCIFCGTVLSQQGGEWMPLGGVALWLTLALVLGVLMHRSPDILLLRALELVVQSFLIYKIAALFRREMFGNNK